MAELEQRLSGLEWAEWSAFMAEEGLVPSAHDIRHAELRADVHNGLLPRKGGRAWHPTEFLRQRWVDPEAQRREKRQRMVRGGQALMAALRGK